MKWKLYIRFGGLIDLSRIAFAPFLVGACLQPQNVQRFRWCLSSGVLWAFCTVNTNDMVDEQLPLRFESSWIWQTRGWTYFALLPKVGRFHKGIWMVLDMFRSKIKVRRCTTATATTAACTQLALSCAMLRWIGLLVPCLGFNQVPCEDVRWRCHTKFSISIWSFWDHKMFFPFITGLLKKRIATVRCYMFHILEHRMSLERSDQTLHQGLWLWPWLFPRSLPAVSRSQGTACRVERPQLFDRIFV